MVGNATTNTWNPLVGNGANMTAPHADSRGMVFDSTNNTILQIDDGGIYRLTNATAAARAWEALHGNLGLAELYSVALDITTGRILGGAQDNGIALQQGQGIDQWNLITEGDGTIVQYFGNRYFYSTQKLGQFSVNTAGVTSSITTGAGPTITGIAQGGGASTIRLAVASSAQNSFYNGTLIRISGGPGLIGETFAITNYVGATRVATIAGNWTTNPAAGTTYEIYNDLKTFDGNIRFVQPYYLNAADPTNSRMLIGTGNVTDNTGFLYESNNINYAAPVNGTVPATFRLLNAGALPAGTTAPPVAASVGRVNSVVYGGFASDGTPMPNVGYVGTQGSPAGDFLFVRQAGQFGQFSPITSYTTQVGVAVKAVAVDPKDWTKVFVLTTTGDVWTSNDGATAPGGAWTWTSRSRSLVALPGVSNLQTLEVDTTNGKTVILVGGEGGVFRQIDGGPWSEFGTGLPNVLVTDIDYIPKDANPGTVDDVLLISTLGRGAWTITNVGQQLVTEPVVTVKGRDGVKDHIGLEVDTFRPWLVDIHRYEVGDIDGGIIPDLSLDMTSIGRIDLYGKGDNDVFVIDTTAGGPIFIPGLELSNPDKHIEHIAVHGGDGTDSLTIIVDGTPAFDSGFKILIGGKGIHKIYNPNDFGQTAYQHIEFEGVEIPSESTSLQYQIKSVKAGLQATSKSLTANLPGAMRGQALGGLDATSVATGANGLRVEMPRAKDDAIVTVASAAPGALVQIDNATSLFQRLFEEGLGALSLTDISEDGLFSDPTKLEAALEGLDGIDNVDRDFTTDQDGDGTPDLTYTVGIEKRLDAIIGLDVAADVLGFLGDVKLTGNLEIEFDVKVHLVFGLDSHGFFIKPDATLPEISLSNISIAGEALGRGRLGFLGVDLLGGTLTLDPNVSIDINLLDPETEPDTVGFIRIPELFQDDFSSLLTVSLDGNGDALDGVANDMEFTGTFGVSVILPGVDSGIHLLDADVKLAWADLTDPTSVHVSAASGDGQRFLDFLKVNSQEVVDQLTTLQKQIDGVFGTEVPFLSDGLTKLVGFVETFQHKVLDPITGGISGGTASVSTIQDLIVTLAGSLGLSLDQLGLAYDSDSKELTFHLKLDESIDDVKKSLGAGVDSDGLADVRFSTEAEVDATVTLDTIFGVDLAAVASGVGGPLDWVFLRNPMVTASATISAGDVEASARFGFLSIGIDEGTMTTTDPLSILVKLNDLGSNDPPNAPNGRIDFSELLAGLDHLDQLVSVEGTGGLTLVLPVETSLPGLLGLGDIPDGTDNNTLLDRAVTVTIPDLSDTDSIDVTLGDDLKDILGNFTNMDAGTFVSLLGGVSNWLEDFRRSDTFAAKDIPFVGPALDNVLMFANVLSDALLFDDGDDGVDWDDKLITDLNNALAEAGIGDQIVAQVDGDRIKLIAVDRAVTAFTVKRTSGNHADADLHLPTTEQAATAGPDGLLFIGTLAAAPANGQLGGTSGDAVFTIRIDGGGPVTVTLPRLETNGDGTLAHPANTGLGNDVRKLLDANSQPTFQTVQQMAGRLVDILGAGDIVTYHAADDPLTPADETDTLTIDLDLSGFLGQIDLPIDFSLVDLAPVFELVSDSTIRLSASGSLTLTLGLYLGNEGGVTLSNETSLSSLKLGYGRLSDDAHFSLKLGTADPVAVVVAASATQDNVDADGLVADINAALIAAGLDSQVTASHTNRVVLTAAPGVTSMQVTAAAGDPAITQIGLTTSQTVSLPHQFNIEFDYSYDDINPNPFFSDALRKQILEAAASYWESKIGDDFPNLPQGTSIKFADPNQAAVTYITKPSTQEIDDLLIFVGAADFGVGDVTLAAGSFGPSPVLNNGSDFEPRVGSITFNTRKQAEWYFDPTPSDPIDDLPDLKAGPTNNKYDFLTTSIHEIGHILGFDAADSLNRYLNPKISDSPLPSNIRNFTGPKAESVNHGSPIPFFFDTGTHVAGSTTGLIQNSHDIMSVMVSGIDKRVRLLPQPLDSAILQDIGYKPVTAVTPGPLKIVGTRSIGFNDQRAVAAANDVATVYGQLSSDATINISINGSTTPVALTVPRFAGTPGTDINVTHRVNDQSETAIAINPTNPDNIIIGVNDDDPVDGLFGSGSSSDHVYVTTNGGQHWGRVAIPPPAGVVGGTGDPTIVFDRTGRAVYAHVVDTSFGPNGTHEHGPASDDQDHILATAVSMDGGLTWINPTKVTAVDADLHTDDKVFLAVGPDKLNTSRDRFVVVFSERHVVYASTSLDGVTWSTPVAVSNAAGGSSTEDLPPSGRAIDAIPAIGANGNIYVVWEDFSVQNVSKIMFDVSIDGGAHWGGGNDKTVLWDTNKSAISDLSAADVLKLDQFAALLKADPQLVATISGYTDTQGTSADNATLAQNRANAVRDYLVGIKSVSTSQLTVLSFGEAQLAVDTLDRLNDSVSGTAKAANRRVELTLDRLVYTGSINVHNDTTSGGDFKVPAQPSRGIWMGLSMDVDRSGGVNDGRIYVAFADQGDLDDNATTQHDNTDIFVIASDNDGRTWTTLGTNPADDLGIGPKRVNFDDTTTSSQFFSWLDVDQSTGNVAVSWYDARNDDGAFGVGDHNGTANDDVEYFASFSTDGGVTWAPNIQVSDFASSAIGTNGGDYGDYTALAFANGTIHMAWADTSDSATVEASNPDGALFFPDVYYDRITLQNSAVSDLLSDINAAIAATPALAGKIEAQADGNRVVLVAIDSTVISVQITAANGDPAITQIGFRASQTAQPDTADGNKLKIKAAAEVSGFVGRLSGDAVFQVSMDTVNSGTPVTVTVDAADTAANRNIIDTVRDVQNALDAVGLAGKLTVSSSGKRLLFTSDVPGTTTISIIAEPGSVAATELGLGTSLTGSGADLIITTRNNVRHEITLDGVTTFGGVISAIETQTSGAVTVEYSDRNSRLKLIDNSGGTSANFKVQNAFGSQAGFDLGIVGENNPAQDTGNHIPDNEIEGGQLGGVDLLSRLFIQNAVAQATVTIDTPGGLNASARFGFVGIKAEGDGTITGTISVGLKRPEDTTPGGRITLKELVENIDQIGDFIARPNLTGGGSINLGVELIDSLNIPFITLSNAQIGIDVLNLGDIFNHFADNVTPLNGVTRVDDKTFTLSGDYRAAFAKGAKVTVGSFTTFVSALAYDAGTGPGTDKTTVTIVADDVLPALLTGLTIGTPTAPAIDFSFTGLGDLLSFDNVDFGFGSIIDALLLVSDFLGQFEQFSFLDEPLPLVNRSVNDMLSFVNEVADAIEGLQQNPAGSIQVLEGKLKEAFGIVAGNDLSALGFPDSSSSPVDVGSVVADRALALTEFPTENVVFLVTVGDRPSRLVNVSPAGDLSTLLGNINNALDGIFGDGVLEAVDEGGKIRINSVAVEGPEALDVRNVIDLSLVTDKRGTLDETKDDIKILRLALGLGAGFSESLGLEIPDIPLPAGSFDLGGSANLQATGSASLRIDLGIDIADPSKIYVFEGTGVKGILDLNGDALSFRAGLGPFSLSINDGSAAIDGFFDLGFKPSLFGGVGRALISDLEFGGDVTFVGDHSFSLSGNRTGAIHGGDSVTAQLATGPIRASVVSVGFAEQTNRTTVTLDSGGPSLNSTLSAVSTDGLEFGATVVDDQTLSLPGNQTGLVLPGALMTAVLGTSTVPIGAVVDSVSFIPLTNRTTVTLSSGVPMLVNDPLTSVTFDNDVFNKLDTDLGGNIDVDLPVFFPTESRGIGSITLKGDFEDAFNGGFLVLAGNEQDPLFEFDSPTFVNANTLSLAGKQNGQILPGAIVTAQLGTGSITAVVNSVSYSVNGLGPGITTVVLGSPDLDNTLTSVTFTKETVIFDLREVVRGLTAGFENLSLLDQILFIVDGVDVVLGGVQGALDGDIMGFSLPLIGDKLAGGADVIGDFRTGFLNDFRTEVEKLADPSQNGIKDILFKLLGPAGLDLLIATTDEVIHTGTATSAAQFTLTDSAASFAPDLLKGTIVRITSGMGSGQTRTIISNTATVLIVDEAWDVIPGTSNYEVVNLAGDAVKIGGKFVDGGLNDITSFNNLANVTETADAEIWWKVKIGQNLLDRGADIRLDLGIPGLGLETDGEIELNIDWELDLGFGLSGADGFFFFIDDADELLLNASVTLPDASLKGTLGFLEFTAVNQDVDDNNLDGNTHLAASFAIDIRNDSALSDRRLGLSELGRMSFDVLVGAEASAELAMTLGIAGDNGGFPQIKADFLLDWAIDGSPAAGIQPVSLFNPPAGFNFSKSIQSGLQVVEFRDVSLDMGAYITDVVGPIVRKIQEVTAPVQPIIDIVTTPLPVLSDLGLDITLLDIAKLTGTVDVRFIEALESIQEVVSLIDSIEIPADGSLLVPFGKFTIFERNNSLFGTLASELGGFDLGSSDFNLAGFADKVLDPNGAFLGQLISGLPAGLQDVLDEVAGIAGDILKGLADDKGGSKKPFSFPIIQDPSQVFGILTGKSAVLVAYDMPALDFKAEFTQFFPIFGPLGLSINLDAALTIDFAFGYDTTGFIDFADSGFKNPFLLANGLYVSDDPTNPLYDGTGGDPPELIFDGGLWAAAELNLGIARAGVGGGIFIGVDFNLSDPNDDGRIRLDELAANVLNQLKAPTAAERALAPLAVFDVSGKVTAELFAFLKINLPWPLPDINKKFNITDPITLVDFDVEFFHPPVLATELVNGDLMINIGDFAEQRVLGAPSDIGEHIFIEDAPLFGPGKVAVWSDNLGDDATEKQIYSVTGKIIAVGGEGDDIIDLSGVSTITFELEGGAGRDTIKGGHGGGIIRGGVGDDLLLKGGSGDDLIFGNEGSDVIEAGDGADIVLGDGGEVSEGFDLGNRHGFVRGRVALTDGADFLYGGGDDDILIGSGEADVIDGGDKNDLIIGDGALLTFNSPAVVTESDKDPGGFGDNLSGGEGDDVLYGGAGNDTIGGGAGKDIVFGDSGMDTIHGGVDDDTLFGDFGMFLDGDLAKPVVTEGGEGDTISGGLGKDKILGGGGNDVIHGDNGSATGVAVFDDDLIWGGTGADTMYGDGGDDTIYGESDPDKLYGDDGKDYLEGGQGNDLAWGGAGDDLLVGGFGSDKLDGEGGSDTYRITARGGLTTELTTTYDSGAVTDGTDILVLIGTAERDTVLLRAMADFYFPTLEKLIGYPANPDPKAEGLTDKIFASGEPDKLRALLQALEDSYGPHDIPAGLVGQIIDLYVAEVKDAVLLAVDDHHGPDADGIPSADFLKKLIFDDHGADPDTGILTSNSGLFPGKLEEIRKAITEAYGDNPVPPTMFDAIANAWDKADKPPQPNALKNAIENAIDLAYKTETQVLGSSTDTGFVALINNGGANVERFNYRDLEGLEVNTLAKDDYVVLDDVIAPTTINLGLGQDKAQVGQVFRSERVRDPGIELITGITAEDVYTTLEITRGWLSNGVSEATTINGGDDGDQFTVFHNVAVLNLNGGDGDDVFTVRAFALKGSSDSERARTDMKGDGGADTILYVVNAPVGIDGGDGFDTVRIVGTEFADDFVVTDAGIFGGGLNVTYVNIEKVVADGAEGDDRFFIQSTGLEVVTEIDGGLGSDSFFVGGNPSRAPVAVVSNDFKGHSGIILHSIEVGSDAAWLGVPIEGLSANVGDNEDDFVLVRESGGSSRVVEGATGLVAGWSYDGYGIRLTRRPGAGQVVTLVVVPAGMAPEDKAKGFKDLEFFAVTADPNEDLGASLGFNALTGVANAPTLTFDASNWDELQYVRFQASDDIASEGRRFVFINHTLKGSTDPGYQAAKMLSVKVEMLDNDRDGVIITPSGRDNTVLENGLVVDGFKDFFDVVLSKEPTADVTVTLNVLNGQITLDKLETGPFVPGSLTLTFTTTNWDDRQQVWITAPDDVVVEGFHTDYISYTVTSADIVQTLPSGDGAAGTATVFVQVDGNFDTLDVDAIPDAKPTSYVLLKHKPIPGSLVEVTVGGAPLAINRFEVSGNTLTFLSASGVAEFKTGAVFVKYTYNEVGYDGSFVKDSVVDIYDEDTPTVIVRPLDSGDGSIDVIEVDPADGSPDTDLYSLRLSQAPTSNVVIKVNAVDTRSTYGRTALFQEQVTVNDASETFLTFTSGNWFTAQNVIVRAIDDLVFDGNDTQVFAPDLQTVNKIRGPLIIEGAAGAGSLSLPKPLMLPHERNILDPDGNVQTFTPGSGEGAIETMTVLKDDLLAVLKRLNEEDSTVSLTDLQDLVDKTLELSSGPGTGVVLDPLNPDDLFDRFWQILSLVPVIDADADPTNDLVTLRLLNPSIVDPASIASPTAASQYAITSLSANLFAKEVEQIDFLFVFDDDSVANESGALTSADGVVRGFAQGAQTTMDVEAGALQAVLKLDNITQLAGLRLDISVGPGLGRSWTIDSVTGTGDVVTLVLSGDSAPTGEDPTDRSEFRIAGGDTRGRIVGFGMGPNILFNGRPQPGGISYGDIEVVQVSLGRGNDAVRVDYATNAEDHVSRLDSEGDYNTQTLLDTGAGNDNVIVNLKNGEDGAFALNLNTGNDTADGSASTLPLVIFGWDGADTITGGAGDDILFGDRGRVDYIQSVPTDINGDKVTDVLIDQIITRLGHSVASNPVNPPVTGASLFTVSDSTANFSTEYGGLAGLSVQAISPDGHVQFRTIVSNTATTITIDRPWDATPTINTAGVGQKPNNYFYRVSALPEDQTDGLFRGPRVVWSIDNEIGDIDTINGGIGRDMLVGGAGVDTINGGADNDWIVGDNARFDFEPVAGNDGLTRITSINTTGLDVGSGDTISGDAGADIVLGGKGGDSIFGDNALASNGASDLADVILGDNGQVDFQNGVINRIFTTDVLQTTGGADTIHGNAANDIILGGVNGSSDELFGDGGDDILLGDNGELIYNDVIDSDLTTLDFVRTLDVSLGGADTIHGNAGRDLIFGGKDGDTIDGGSEDDLIFGDFAEAKLLLNQFNVVKTLDPTQGGADVISGNEHNDVLVGGALGDTIDGDTGDDLIFGDAVQLLWRLTDITDPRFETLAGTQIYNTAATNSSGGDLLDGIARNYRDPNGTSAPLWAHWQIQDLRHTAALAATPDNSFGSDYIAGGADHDMIFGQLGNDTIQGDGSIEFSSTGNYGAIGTHVGATRDGLNALLLNPSFEAASDGDDYIEGNGGSDVIFGGLGQDDIIGGSSDLYTLDTYAERPDGTGTDTIFGGAGMHAGRNDLSTLDGVSTNQLHARDSDTILGDNGDIFRVVGINHSDTGILSFNYDLTSQFEDRGQVRIIVRAARLLDYTPGGPDFTTVVEAGQADIAINPGTSLRDIGAADEIHGESGDDFIYGMVGNDALFGDGQDDNMVGGYGADWMSGGTGDDGMLGDDGRLFTSRNSTSIGEPLYGIAPIPAANINQLIQTNGGVNKAIINVNGLLKYTADLTPQNLQPSQPTPPDPLFRPLYANDIMYGGLGSDSIHSGAGDDAISGAEALSESYSNNYDQNGNKILSAVQSDFFHPFNPGNVLGYNPTTTKFFLYDANDGRRKILLNNDGTLNKFTTGKEWILNVAATEGPADTKWIAGTAFLGKPTDGDDHLFADLGNDWAVGGTGRDVLYGGWGDDLLNADDDLTSAGGLNNVTDTNPSYEDMAFGGAGRDVLILNTNGDRGMDWVGEFNTFLTSFSQFGAVSVSRLLQPGLPTYLYALSKSNGADQTLAVQYGSDLARNGEPFGELGLVLQQDAAWQAQSGAPRDPQAGNVNGGRVDVNNNPGTTGTLPLYQTAAGLPPTTGTVALLSDSQLSQVVVEAKLRWAQMLGADSRLALLDSVRVEVGNLPEENIGITIGSSILIDSDAAGRGWFIDATPQDDAEFRFVRGLDEWIADVHSPAFGRMDLLTTVMHELGHVLGFDDQAAQRHSANLMTETLSTGVRRSPLTESLIGEQFAQSSRQQSALGTEAFSVQDLLGHSRNTFMGVWGNSGNGNVATTKSLSQPMISPVIDWTEDDSQGKQKKSQGIGLSTQKASWLGRFLIDMGREEANHHDHGIEIVLAKKK